ncbi:YdiU family protein [Thiomicrorhabdus sp. zzn3]|uniref:protein adenylyltransferase SelO n=1 Tax=Thiomicrorhabdus sp. zzn3 TaxID=3039775 RepID=UPI002436C4FF|nr:YdiU family protein [Thiomicrorhabdus sp. zzn3]MDG6779131.1 YdiU family protein [Thiomicrorhabdus sp. zzn3]
MNCFFNRYADLPNHFYSYASPEPLEKAVLVHRNPILENELALTLTEAELIQMSSGNQFPQGCSPLAQKYTGHQFGHYNPDLGDGRGLLLGQWHDSQQQSWDFHLKGCGRTPYSRRGDGRAVLRSAIREYLGSEALHALGIPSTRCLALCHSDERVQREQLEPRASYIRVAKTHVRFGHFEWLAQHQDKQGMQQLADYVIETVYPDLIALPEANRYARLLETICAKTAKLIAAWQAIGFCHGVLNTDNMSVAGETFDFGPFAFMDDFKLHYICNHSDFEGRYAYSQQPNIGYWNCQVLAGAFGLLVDDQAQHKALNTYIETYNRAYLSKMLAKLGLSETLKGDKLLVADLIILMDQSSLDFHQFFLSLADCKTEQACLDLKLIKDTPEWRKWLQAYYQRRAQEQDPQNVNAQIRENTPKFVLRNYIAQEVIEAAERGDFSLFEQCFNALHSPYVRMEDIPQRYYQPPQNPIQKGIALSCSS